MDTKRGIKEKSKFASPVPRGGQNEGKRKNQVQKEEMVKKIRNWEEKESGEGERETVHASGPKEFDRGEVLGWSGSTGVEPKQTKILDSCNDILSVKVMKGGKFAKPKRKKMMKCVKSEEKLVAAGAVSGIVQRDGGGVAESEEQDGDPGKLLKEKPMHSGGAEIITLMRKESKTKKKAFGVEVQVEGIKKKKSNDLRADKERKRGDEERTGNSMDSKKKASQRATARLGKSKMQSFKSKDPQPISSLLSDSQYNEIFESVLDSSLEHCLEDARVVLSEVELLQASIGESCERAGGGNGEGEHDCSQSSRHSQQTGRAKKRKLQQKSVEKTGGKQAKECEQEHKNSSCTEDEYDLWAQCSRNSCKKWRKLKWHEDLSVLPADWVCSQNTDPHHNSCDCPEENWSGSEEDLVHSNLVPGSMVWAQQPGFPWWPAMIEIDPDSKSFFLFKNKKDKSPCKYHVTYLGEPVSRAWVSACRVKAFHTLSEEVAVRTVKQQSYKKMFSASLNMSRQAEKLPLQQRLAQFGFLSRYKDRKFSVEDDITESNEEYSCDEDFAGTDKKSYKKGSRPVDKKKAARLASTQKQNGSNGLKLNELGKKEKGRKNWGRENGGEKKKAMNTPFSGPKKKAPSRSESAGEANACGKELEEGVGVKKKVPPPSFTKLQDINAEDKQALEKPQLQVRERTSPGTTAYRGQEGGEGEGVGEIEGEKGLGSTAEDRNAGKIKETEEWERTERSGEEKKRKIQPEVKRKWSVTKKDGRESTSETEMKEESEGEELEKECMNKSEKSAALEDLTGFLEDDMDILNCQQEFFRDVGSEEEDDGDGFTI